MKRPLLISAAAVTVTLAVAGCGASTSSGGSSASSMSGMSGMDNSSTTPSSSPGASDSASASGSAGTSVRNAADTMFAQMMIPHHQQAIEMSDMLLAKQGIDQRVRDIAQKIKAEQGPEIKTLTSWLNAWGDPTSMSSGSMSGGSMGGMMSSGDMQKLQDASGVDAAKLFLTQMTQHHDSAISMAKQEVANGSNPDAVAMAKSIVSSQQQQMTQMKDLLTKL